MKQPALASSLLLSRGNLTADFEVVSGDPVQVKAKVALRNLMTRQGNQPLGDLDCPLTATLKADGSAGTVKLPLTLAVGDRRSDLTLDGTFSRAAATWSFSGKIGSNQLVVDDFKALAALAPQGPASSEPAASKPAGGDAAPSKPPGEKAGTSIPAAAQGTAAPAAAAAPARDIDPFWKGMGGRIDYTISDIDCGAAITAKWPGRRFEFAADFPRVYLSCEPSHRERHQQVPEGREDCGPAAAR
jgi:hypothetical protein